MLNHAARQRAMWAAARREVLLVEDDASMREAIQRLLYTANFECSTYASAEALLAGGAHDGAECVVSDLKLPGISGLDLLTELRARGSRLPIIMITAHDTPGLREEAVRRGVAAFLVKPFRGNDLLDAVKAAIDPARR
ncbi:MAG TPA: response regulator [Burkholderiales bacterium]|nr:response regulator [Burkholderiales bacterium]